MSKKVRCKREKFWVFKRKKKRTWSDFCVLLLVTKKFWVVFKEDGWSKIIKIFIESGFCSPFHWNSWNMNNGKISVAENDFEKNGSDLKPRLIKYGNTKQSDRESRPVVVIIESRKISTNLTLLTNTTISHRKSISPYLMPWQKKCYFSFYFTVPTKYLFLLVIVLNLLNHSNVIYSHRTDGCRSTTKTHTHTRMLIWKAPLSVIKLHFVK